MTASGWIPSPPLPRERRRALVVATSTHGHDSYGHLAAPALDAQRMTRLLEDPDVCGFQVETLVDRPSAEVRLAINEIFNDCHPDDLVLVYFSGHGVRDQNGRLHFVATDTDPATLPATGVAARYLLDLAQDSAARRQIVVLDCCFSGAFNVKGVGFADFATDAQADEAGSGGLCILTASRAAEYSFQDTPQTGSVFTSALVEGVMTGEADVASNGRITVADAYRYAYLAVKAKHRRQTPQFHVYGAEGSAILFARNPVGIKAGAEDLYETVTALREGHPHQRLAALNTLASLMDDDNPAKAAAARQALETEAATADSALAPIAQQLLDARTAAARQPPTLPDDDFADDDLPYITEEELAGLQPTHDPLGVFGPNRLVHLMDEPTPLVARHLYPTERYRGEWRRHWSDPALTAAISGLASGLAFRLPSLQPLNLPPQLWEFDTPTAARWLLIAVAVIAGRRALGWPLWRFALTDKRLLIVRGILWRRAASIPIQLLANVRLSQSPLGGLLNYGTLTFDTGRWRSHHVRRMPNLHELHLRILEEKFEPGAVEMRLGSNLDDEEDAIRSH